MLNKNGFTLIELIVTVVIVAIGAALAVPSFSAMIRNQRLTSQANHLLSTIQLARSEAIKRGVRVTLRHEGSTDGNWDGGWKVFVDYNGDGTYTTTDNDDTCQPGKDCYLAKSPALKSNMTLRGSDDDGNIDWFGYLPSGRPTNLAASGGIFNLCGNMKDSANNAITNESNARSIKINSTGSPVVTRGASTCP